MSAPNGPNSPVATGLVVTAALEMCNVYVLHRWAYGVEMPRVFGVGITPLLQWLLLPPATLWLARRHLGWTPGRLSPFTGTHT